MRKYTGSLHNHTDHSNIRLRDSINRIESLIDYALELGHEVIALTDHECISSFIKIEEYYEKIKKAHPDFKVIRGNEIYLTRNNLNNANFVRGQDGYFHFILLAKDLEGYHQICELSTRAWKRSYSAQNMIRVPTYYQDLRDIVMQNKGHLIASSACLGGQLPKFILKYRDTGDASYLETARDWCIYMVNMFGEGNFYLEMQPSNDKDQIYVNQTLLALSKELNIDYIITTDSHYLKKEDAKIHEAFLNAQDGEREVSSFYATTYMMGTEELESYFPYFNDSVLETAYDNIRKIKNACEDYSIKRPLRIPCLPWYNYDYITIDEINKYMTFMPSLEKFNTSEFKEDRELVKAIIAGIKRHPDLQTKEAYEALEECLDMTWVSSKVNKANWSAYYLNIQRIIDECWNAGSIVLPARGSGGGFVLLYCLDIIQLNALRESTKCFPWRFLNPERVSVLDIDFDISGLKRAKVLAHFRKVYGEDRVCNVATFRTEKSKSAIKTAARGLGYPNEVGDMIASLVDAKRGANYTLSQMYYGDEKEGIKADDTFVRTINEYEGLWEVASKIEGLICGLG